jgi:hypothetical protein
MSSNRVFVCQRWQAVSHFHKSAWSVQWSCCGHECCLTMGEMDWKKAEMAGVAFQNKLHSGLHASQWSLTTASGLMNRRLLTLIKRRWITLHSIQCNGNHWRDKILLVCACLVARMLTDAYREITRTIITDCNIQIFNHRLVSPTFTRTSSIVTNIQNKH